jgi:hypothetical protein
MDKYVRRQQGSVFDRLGGHKRGRSLNYGQDAGVIHGYSHRDGHGVTHWHHSLPSDRRACQDRKPSHRVNPAYPTEAGGEGYGQQAAVDCGHTLNMEGEDS